MRGAMHPAIDALTPGMGLMVEIINIGERDPRPEALLDETDRAFDFPLRLWGVGLTVQTRGATPMEAMKSAKRAFQRGVLFSMSTRTLFMRSVKAALGSPPKYSKASIKHRIMVGQSHRLTKVTKRMRE
jgi:hypothetical protein